GAASDRRRSADDPRRGPGPRDGRDSRPTACQPSGQETNGRGAATSRRSDPPAIRWDGLDTVTWTPSRTQVAESILDLVSAPVDSRGRRQAAARAAMSDPITLDPTATITLDWSPAQTQIVIAILQGVTTPTATSLQNGMSPISIVIQTQPTTTPSLASLLATPVPSTAVILPSSFPTSLSSPSLAYTTAFPSGPFGYGRAYAYGSPYPYTYPTYAYPTYANSAALNSSTANGSPCTIFSSGTPFLGVVIDGVCYAPWEVPSNLLNQITALSTPLTSPVMSQLFGPAYAPSYVFNPYGNPYAQPIVSPPTYQSAPYIGSPPIMPTAYGFASTPPYASSPLYPYGYAPYGTSAFSMGPTGSYSL